MCLSQTVSCPPGSYRYNSCEWSSSWGFFRHNGELGVGQEKLKNHKTSISSLHTVQLLPLIVLFFFLWNCAIHISPGCMVCSIYTDLYTHWFFWCVVVLTWHDRATHLFINLFFYQTLRESNRKWLHHLINALCCFAGLLKPSLESHLICCLEWLLSILNSARTAVLQPGSHRARTEGRGI